MATNVIDLEKAKAALQNCPPRAVVKKWLDKYPTLVQEIKDANARHRTRPAFAKAVVEIVQHHTKKLYRQPMNYVNLTYYALGEEAFKKRFESVIMGPLVEKAVAALQAKAA
jgi:hypothetical protein